MRQKKLWFMFTGVLTVLGMVLMLPAGSVAASKYKLLHKFTGLDGDQPYDSLIFDASGNLYGTTRSGAFYGCGVVFKLTPNANGTWTESVLHTFNGVDGCFPWGSLTFDAAGNLYGTTSGSDGTFACPVPCGTVFKLTPNSDGTWTESVLYGFTGGTDGGGPLTGVIFDAAGNLYGTTELGGAFTYFGTVFKLTPNSDGTWTESVLHSFNKTDGELPYGGLIFDGAGNLYGTTNDAGANGRGVTVFKLTPNWDGGWTESVLHSFCSLNLCADGAAPRSSLIFDAAGNLYGTTVDGGNFNACEDCGTVFELKPNSDGRWTERVLHSFTNRPAAFPYAGLTFDAAGNLYGTTVGGGDGTVFKLTPSSGGRWAWSVLHVFLGKPARLPVGGLVLDKAGNLYGTTLNVVFEITPQLSFLAVPGIGSEDETDMMSLNFVA
jgi:uncharacterized repeat protein (TIGR03803 family)